MRTLATHAVCHIRLFPNDSNRACIHLMFAGPVELRHLGAYPQISFTSDVATKKHIYERISDGCAYEATRNM